MQGLKVDMQFPSVAWHTRKWTPSNWPKRKNTE